jgi:hypothetical protein
MATYNTGNPIGSSDPRDLYDNAEGLDQATNSQELVWQDRLGNTRKTLKGIEADTATGSYTVRLIEDLNAISPPEGTKPGGRVTEGPGKGYYTWENGAWVETEDPLEFNSLTVNRGQAYPLLRKIRGGVDSGARQEFLNCILHMRVFGADPLYYYRPSIFGNGSAANGGPTGQGFRVEKLLKSTFESTGAALIIHNTTSAVGLGLDYVAKGLQYRRVQMDADPSVTIEFVIDVDQLPAYGTAIVSATNSSAGYNWVTDPVEYRTEPYPDGSADIDLSGIDSVSINVEKEYPMLAAARGGTAPLNVHQTLKAALVDIQVIKARPGYVYRLGYYGNGVMVDEVANYGFSVYRIPVDRLSEGYQQAINVYNAASAANVRFVPDRVKGGIQTYEFACADDPETRINLSFDVDKLPADGSPIVSVGTAHSGFNSIISPSKYTIDIRDNFIEGDTLVDWDADTKKLIIAYKSGSKWYNVRFQRKSINQTFTILGFGYDDAYKPVLDDIFPVQNVTLFSRTEAASDWIAPMTFRLANGGDEGATTAIYTGGSHGTDNAAGDATSEMKMLEIFVDDVRLDQTRSLRRKLCKSVKVLTKQDVQAYNTIISKRTALEEYVRFDISSKGVHVHKVAKALYDLIFTADNGCQVYMAGLTPQNINTYLFWGGKQTVRTTMTDGVAFFSGPKGTYCNCLGVSIRHAAAGEFNAWVDPKFGLGARPTLLDTENLFRFDGDGKIYPVLCSVTSPFEIQAGQTYEWRGGYSWGMPTLTDNFDCLQQTQMGDVFVKKDGTYIIA